jgi:hypothetical protein
MKVMIITNIPNPYRIPLFNLLNEKLKEWDITLRIVFGAKSSSRRKFILNFSECHFDYRILKSHKLQLFDKERVLFTYYGLLY